MVDNMIANTLNQYNIDNLLISNIYTKQQLDLLYDEDFKNKLESVYNLFIKLPNLITNDKEPIPFKFGAAKNIIEYVSDDFDAPLTEEFKEYV
jgi:hypothetical protein